LVRFLRRRPARRFWPGLSNSFSFGDAANIFQLAFASRAAS
jgi:hypothetical protein